MNDRILIDGIVVTEKMIEKEVARYQKYGINQNREKIIELLVADAKRRNENLLKKRYKKSAKMKEIVGSTEGLSADELVKRVDYAREVLRNKKAQRKAW